MNRSAGITIYQLIKLLKPFELVIDLEENNFDFTFIGNLKENKSEEIKIVDLNHAAQSINNTNNAFLKEILELYVFLGLFQVFVEP